MEYVDLMKELRLELAAEYLVMAAMLAEIKSKMLLPRQDDEEAEEDDPRAELIRRLQEYERYKQAAEDLDELPRLERDQFQVEAEMQHKKQEQKLPDVDLREMLLALKDVLHRADMFSSHHVQMEPLSVRERMSLVLGAINSESFTDFADLFDVEEGRMGVVVTFLSILELIKDGLIVLVQVDAFGPIHVKAASE
jgi:segregation and condensation protein A